MKWTTKSPTLRTLATALMSLLAYLGCVVSVASEPVEITPEYRSEIERLMEVTRMDRMAEQMNKLVGQQIANMRDPDTPEDLVRIQAIVSEMLTESKLFEDLLDEMIPLYAKYFSQEDIRQMIEWYELPIGKKSIEIMPQLMQDVSEMSMRYTFERTQDVMGEVMERLREEGLIKSKEHSEDAPTFEIVSNSRSEEPIE